VLISPIQQRSDHGVGEQAVAVGRGAVAGENERFAVDRAVANEFVDVVGVDGGGGRQKRVSAGAPPTTP